MPGIFDKVTDQLLAALQSRSAAAKRPAPLTQYRIPSRRLSDAFCVNGTMQTVDRADVRV